MQDAGWDIIVILLNSFCLAGTAGLDLGPEKLLYPRLESLNEYNGQVMSNELAYSLGLVGYRSTLIRNFA